MLFLTFSRLFLELLRNTQLLEPYWEVTNGTCCCFMEGIARNHGEIVMLFRCLSREKILHVIGDSWRSVSQGLRFRKTLLASYLLYILTWKCSWTFVLRWDSNVAAIRRFWIHCGHLGRVWLSLMLLMAYQTMERFTRLEIQTFSYCVGANGPRLFIFSGKSPQKVRTPSAVVFLLITSFL